MQREMHALHRKVDALGSKMEQMGETVDRVMMLCTAILAALGGHASQLAMCDPADVALVESTVGSLLPKPRADSRASPAGASLLDGCDTRLPPTPTSAPPAKCKQPCDWANQSASIKAAPLAAPSPSQPMPTRARAYKMAKIRVVQTNKGKDHKLMAALLKPAEEGFDGLPPSFRRIVKCGSSVGVIVSDTAVVEPEPPEKKKKNRVEERLPYRDYLRYRVAMRNKRRSGPQAVRPTKEARTKAGVKPSKPQKVVETITDERRELIRRARAVGLASRTYNPAAVRAAAVAVQKFWARILRPSRRQVRPLVSAFAAPAGEALAKLFDKPHVTGTPISAEALVKKEEEKPAAVVEGLAEEGGVVPKLEVTVLERKAHIEAEQAVAQAAAGGHLQRAGHMADVSAAIQGRPAMRDMIKRIEAKGLKEGLAGFRTQTDNEVCAVVKNQTLHVSSPKAKPFTELDRAASSVTNFCEGGEAQAGGAMEVPSSLVVGELEVFGG